MRASGKIAATRTPDLRQRAFHRVRVTKFMQSLQGKKMADTRSPLEKLTAIADEIFERWDKDQRSGKLLSALSGALPRYRDDVTDVRRAMAAVPGLLDVVKNATHALEFCVENIKPEAEIFRTKILANIIAGRTAYETATGQPLPNAGVVIVERRPDAA